MRSSSCHSAIPLSHRRLGSIRGALAFAAAATALAACRNAIPPWGAGPAEARRNADNAFAAFSYRFTNVQRDRKFAAARPKMGRYALIPARLYRDSSLWTLHDAPDSSQAIYLDATWENGRYSFTSRTDAPYPRRLGDQRNYIRLARLGEDDYEWVTIVDHGIGPVRSAQVAAALGAWVTSFEDRAGADLLADTRTTYRRTARHLAQLFRIDSLHTSALADGSTALTLSISLHPDVLRRGYPLFAAYLEKYVMPSRYRVQVADRRGASYLDLTGSPGRFQIRLRARDGRLVSLAGPPRPMPDSLQFLADFSAKFRMFRVGFDNLVGDLTIERSEHDRAFMLRFRREPEWRLPLAVNHLIRTPLRKPFEGRGTEVRVSVRDDLGSQAMSLRHIRTVVHESAIMRWLNSLGGTAFGDFEGPTEAEENRFWVGMFEALRQDIAAGP